MNVRALAAVLARMLVLMSNVKEIEHCGSEVSEAKQVK